MITSNLNSVFATLLASAAGAGGVAEFWRGFFNLPPLHPILVHFPVALVPASVACDVLARFTGRESLRSAGWWMLCFAAIITPLAAGAGWLWLYQMGGSDHVHMFIHQWLGTALAFLLIPLTVWRWRHFRRATVANSTFLITAFVFVLAAMFQGHLGGLMSFGTAVADSPATKSDHDHSDGGWQDHIELKDKR